MDSLRPTGWPRAMFKTLPGMRAVMTPRPPQPDRGKSVKAQSFNHIHHALQMTLPGGQKLHLLGLKVEMGKARKNRPPETRAAVIGEDTG